MKCENCHCDIDEDDALSNEDGDLFCSESCRDEHWNQSLADRAEQARDMYS